MYHSELCFCEVVCYGSIVPYLRMSHSNSATDLHSLAEAILTLEKPEELQGLLRDLLTDTERENLLKRWRASVALVSAPHGQTQGETAKACGVSTKFMSHARKHVFGESSSGIAARLTATSKPR